MQNIALLTGNLGEDPDVRTTQSGHKVAKLSVATNERWKDKEGKTQLKTEWHRVTVFGEFSAEFCEKYLHKGDLVQIKGSIHTRKYDDKDGVTRYVTEIKADPFGGIKSLERKDDNKYSSPPQNKYSSPPQEDPDEDTDEDMPF